MNLPNKLTISRILVVPFFILFAIRANSTGAEAPHIIAGLIFAAASVTDWLDGYLARKMKLVSDFGKFADPLADKILTTCALLYMMQAGVCDPLVLCIIMAREFAVAGVRMVAAGSSQGKVIAANMWGKVKTVLQMLVILFYYLGGCVIERAALNSICSILCWAVAVITAVSGGIYLAENRQIFKS